MKIFAPFQTDAYKLGHIFQYPAKTQMVYSNFTCRSDKLASNVLGDFDGKVVFFGLQGVIQELLVEAWGEFFSMPEDEAMAKYQRRMDGFFGGNFDISHMRELHKLGHLPIQIKALPEGSRVNIKVPLFTIRNTRPDFAWLVNYLETSLSAEIWKPITSATTAYEYKRLLSRYAEQTGTDPQFVPWQAHDFSFRGLSGCHDAAVSGAAHLLSFTGTDVVPALEYLEQYYYAAGTFIGGSVPATEHSVMCMGGKEGERETFRRLICDTYPSGIVSIVSDTWDFWSTLTIIASSLKEEILARAGKVVFRPDSGNPFHIICGDPTAPAGSPAATGAVETLWQIFGGTVNARGFKELNTHVGLIYGDSITLGLAESILYRLTAMGFASSIIVFGVGSYTYQYATRDTFGSAMKATYGIVNGESHALSKDPKTDSGLKKSASGLLRVEKEDGNFVLYQDQTWHGEQGGELKVVFCDGIIGHTTTLEEIRERLL